MTKQADRYIAENRQDIKQTTANFIEAAERQSIELSFGRNTIEVDVGVTVYKRSLDTALIVGHPDAAHGIGEGEVGDQRAGSWTQVENSVSTAEFTRGGRTALRNALDGQTGGIEKAGVGTGTADAATGDTALGSLSAKDGATTVSAYKPDAETARGIGVFHFHEHEGSATEFALYNTDGTLICRLTLPSDISPTSTEEVKVEIDLSVDGTGIGDSVITNDGEEAMADALHDPSQNVGLNKIAIGTGSTTFSKTDSALTSETDRKTVIRDLEIEAIRAYTKWYKNEPSGLPTTFTEMAIFDNASTPRMVWATTFEGEEKTDGVPLRASVGFRLE